MVVSFCQVEWVLFGLMPSTNTIPLLVARPPESYGALI